MIGRKWLFVFIIIYLAVFALSIAAVVLLFNNTPATSPSTNHHKFTVNGRVPLSEPLIRTSNYGLPFETAKRLLPALIQQRAKFKPRNDIFNIGHNTQKIQRSRSAEEDLSSQDLSSQDLSSQDQLNKGGSPKHQKLEEKALDLECDVEDQVDLVEVPCGLLHGHTLEDVKKMPRAKIEELFKDFLGTSHFLGDPQFMDNKHNDDIINQNVGQDVNPDCEDCVVCKPESTFEPLKLGDPLCTVFECEERAHAKNIEKFKCQDCVLSDSMESLCQAHYQQALDHGVCEHCHQPLNENGECTTPNSIKWLQFFGLVDADIQCDEKDDEKDDEEDKKEDQESSSSDEEDQDEELQESSSSESEEDDEEKQPEHQEEKEEEKEST